MTPAVAVRLEAPSLRHLRQFVEAARRSRSLHRGLVSPPRTGEQYRGYLARLASPSNQGYLICLPNGELAGVVNVTEIVRGRFQSGYLGYHAFVPHQGQGHLAAGLALVIARVFRRPRGLHRLEANIQPGNVRSIELVKRLGFRLEGLSPRYLKISGRWRDHERWALSSETWKALRATRSHHPPSEVSLRASAQAAFR